MKYKVIILTLTVYILTNSISCVVNNKVAQTKNISLINDSKYGAEDKKKSNTPIQLNDKVAWEELKVIIANDLISVEELDIVDCSNLNRHSYKVKKKEKFVFKIFGDFYTWKVYERDNGICIEMVANNENFFLTINDAQTLLSASKASHFDNLGLESPMILSRTIYLGDDVPKFCKTGVTKYLKDKFIITNNCSIEIIYLYNGTALLYEKEIFKSNRRNPIQLSKFNIPKSDQ